MTSYWDEIVIPLYFGDIPVEMIITDFDYNPGEPPVMPSMNDPGNPGSGAEYEVLEWHIEFPESISGIHIMCTQQMKESRRLAEKIYADKNSWWYEFVEKADESLKWRNAK